MRSILTVFCICFCTIILCNNCSKRIVSSSGRVWYTPEEKKPFQQNVDNKNTNNINDFDNEVFVGKNNNDFNTQQYNNAGGTNNLESAVNASFFPVAQKSALSTLQTSGQQVDLTKNAKSMNRNEVQNGNVVFTPPAVAKDEASQYNTAVSQQINKDVAGYKIQCGNFTKASKAQEIANRLKKNGVKDVDVENTGNTYKVFAGKFASKSAGQGVFNQIKELGYNDIFWVYKK